MKAFQLLGWLGLLSAVACHKVGTPGNTEQHPAQPVALQSPVAIEEYGLLPARLSEYTSLHQAARDLDISPHVLTAASTCPK